jgi:AP-2 complex subunit mu-1
MAENFRTQILNSKDSSVSTHAPVRTLGSCTFMYLRHSDLYILMVTKNNANVMMAFKYMTSVSNSSREATGRPLCLQKP